MKTPINNNIDQLFNKAKADDQNLDAFEKEAMAGFDMLASKEEANELKAALDKRINQEVFIKKESHNPKIYWFAAAGLALVIGLSVLFVLNDSNSISKSSDLAITETQQTALPDTKNELNEEAAAPLEDVVSEKAPAKEISESQKAEQKGLLDEEKEKTPAETKGPSSRMVTTTANEQAASGVAQERKKQESNKAGEGVGAQYDQTTKLDALAKTSHSKDKESDAFKSVPSAVQQSPKLSESEASAKDEIALENKNLKGKNEDADSKKDLNQVATNTPYGGVVNREEKVVKEKSKKARAKQNNSNIPAAPEKNDYESGAPVTTKAAEAEEITKATDDKREDNNFINCYYTGGEAAITKDIKEKLVKENLDQKFDVTLFINEKKTVTKVEFINSYALTKKQKEEVTKQLKTLNKFNFFVSPTQKGEFTYKVLYRP
jgi:hypothetical protein